MRYRPAQIALTLEPLESRVLLDGHLTGALANETTRIADFDIRGDRAHIRAFAEQDGQLLLTVKTNARNSPLQLWKTNGSAESTAKIFEILDDETSRGLNWAWFRESEMVVIGDHAYFVVDHWETLGESQAFSRAAAIELWKTDGTTDGTRLVTTISGFDDPPPYSGEFDVSLHHVNDEAFMIMLSEARISAFASSDYVGSLWVSDGSADGTRAIGGRIEYVNTLALGVPVELNGQWVFGGGFIRGSAGPFANSGLYTVAPELELVERIRPFSGEDAVGVLGTYGLTRVGETIYFAANPPFSSVIQSLGYELWRTDGTPGGTEMVIDIHPGRPVPCCDIAGSSPRGLTDVDGTLFFNAASPKHGRELWKSDGTAEGTTLVFDITPGAESTRFGDETLSSNGMLYFTVVNSDTNGLITSVELWVTDGTDVGTRKLAGDARAFSRTPFSLVDIDGTVFFSLEDGSSDVQIWMTDGTSAGTNLALKIATDTHVPHNIRLIAHDHQLIFAAHESAGDLALWSIDAAGESVLAADVNGNGIVDFTDFLVLAGNFGQDVSRGREDGDIDGDGIVSLADFQILARDFGRT